MVLFNFNTSSDLLSISVHLEFITGEIWTFEGVLIVLIDLMFKNYQKIHDLVIMIHSYHFLTEWWILWWQLWLVFLTTVTLTMVISLTIRYHKHVKVKFCILTQYLNQNKQHENLDIQVSYFIDVRKLWYWKLISY